MVERPDPDGNITPSDWCLIEYLPGGDRGASLASTTCVGVLLLRNVKLVTCADKNALDLFFVMY